MIKFRLLIRSKQLSNLRLHPVRSATDTKSSEIDRTDISLVNPLFLEAGPCGFYEVNHCLRMILLKYQNLTMAHYTLL